MICMQLISVNIFSHLVDGCIYHVSIESFDLKKLGMLILNMLKYIVKICVILHPKKKGGLTPVTCKQCLLAANSLLSIFGHLSCCNI